MKDNRDPSLLGRQIRSLVDDGAAVLQAADVVEVYGKAGSPLPSYEDARDPGEPMCGFPPGGPRPPLPTTEDPADG